MLRKYNYSLGLLIFISDLLKTI